MKHLIDEIFNSQKYEFATIQLTGDTLQGIKIENVTVSIQENYFVIEKSYKIRDVFENQPPRIEKESIFIPYNKIVKITAS